MSMRGDDLLSVSNLKVTFGNQTVLEKINFEVEKNQVLAVIGPNGAGKSVLFRALLGLIPYQGEITWKEGIKIGYVPQKLSVPGDFPLTTQEFLELKEKNRTEIKKALMSVGFEEDSPHQGHLKEHILKRRIGVLSGGELQRVLIAFALLGHPDVLLFDEPTAGVDVSAEKTIYDLLNELKTKENLTILLISHDSEIVEKYADKKLVLGRIK